jgi:uridine phosphorylase
MSEPVDNHGKQKRYITPEVVMQSRFAEHAKPRWDIAVLCFRDSRGSEALVQALGATPLGYKVLWGMDEAVGERPFVHEATVGERRIGVVQRCLWGGPQAAILVEELAYLGVTYVIGFGAAGSIVPGLTKGTQIVASAGIVTDGTSRAYTTRDESAAEPALCATVQAIGEKSDIAITPVKIATVDAVYRETDAAVQSWLDKGAQAINMETTPFYAASAACGIKSVWLGHISDCLVDNTWDTWERPDSMTDRSIAITVGLVHHLTGQKQSRTKEAQ